MKPTKQIYAMLGEYPSNWSETKPLGPFESENQAREAIRADVRNDFDGADLTEGTDSTSCVVYTLVEVLKSFQPVLKVSLEVSLTTPKEKAE